MSIKVMTMVYETKLGGATIKAVALKLADYANDAGGNVWPALDTVAKQTEVSKSSVQRSVRELIEGGILEVVREGGKGAGSTTRYRFNLTQLAAAPKVSEGGQNEEDGHSDHLNDTDKVVTDAEQDGHGDTQSIKRTIKKERESALSDFFELSADWSLPSEWHAWATKESPDHAHLVDNEAKKFRAHWRGKQRECSAVVWEAEWQKWFLRTCERPAAPHAASGAYSVSVAMETRGGVPRDTGEPIALMVARSVVAGTYKGPILPKYRADVDRYVAELRKGAA